MSFALVGTAGAATGPAANNTAVTPAFGAGETRAAGNLLLCWVVGTAAATLPAAPAGWSIALQKTGASCSASLFYLIATGGDAAPTIAGISGVNLSAQVAEFSGNAASSPVDRTANAAGTTSPQTATAASADVAPGELVAYCAAQRYSTGATKTNSVALNNGATATDTTDNSTSTANHFVFGYGITTGNGAADAATLTFTTTNITGTAIALASFLLPAGPAAASTPQLMLTGVGS